MARATKAKAAPEPVEEEEAPLGWLMDKEPSEVHERFVEWIGDEVGYDADLKTVQIVISQWQKFQKTPEQQEFTKARKEAAAAKAEERERKAAEAPAEKPVRGRKAAAAEEAPPARRGGRAARGTVVSAPPVKRATGRRRAAPAPAEADDE